MDQQTPFLFRGNTVLDHCELQLSAAPPRIPQELWNSRQSHAMSPEPPTDPFSLCSHRNTDSSECTHSYDPGSSGTMGPDPVNLIATLNTPRSTPHAHVCKPPWTNHGETLASAPPLPKALFQRDSMAVSPAESAYNPTGTSFPASAPPIEQYLRDVMSNYFREETQRWSTHDMGRDNPFRHDLFTHHIPQLQEGRSAVPMAIFWDIENCSLPSDVPPDSLAISVKNSLLMCPLTMACSVKVFASYGDFNMLPARIREGFQRTGISLVDVPNGRKDAADKAILADLFLFAMDNLPPSCILLITGDVDFSAALHKLGMRGHSVFLAVPTHTHVSRSLTSAAVVAWDWGCLARGHGLVPFMHAPRVYHPRPQRFPRRPSRTYLSNWVPPQILPSVDIRPQIREQDVDSGGVSDGRALQSSSTDAVAPGTISSESASSGSDESTDAPEHYSRRKAKEDVRKDLQESFAVQVSSSSSEEKSPERRESGNAVKAEKLASPAPAGDLSALQSNLIHMVQVNGGKMKLVAVPGTYNSMFGKYLLLSEFGVTKMAHLIEKLDGSLQICGAGQKKFLTLEKVTKKGKKEEKVCGSIEILRRGVSVAESPLVSTGVMGAQEARAGLTESVENPLPAMETKQQQRRDGIATIAEEKTVREVDGSFTASCEIDDEDSEEEILWHTVYKQRTAEKKQPARASSAQAQPLQRERARVLLEEGDAKQPRSSAERPEGSGSTLGVEPGPQCSDGPEEGWSNLQSEVQEDEGTGDELKQSVETVKEQDQGSRLSLPVLQQQQHTFWCSLKNDVARSTPVLNDSPLPGDGAANKVEDVNTQRPHLETLSRGECKVVSEHGPLLLSSLPDVCENLSDEGDAILLNS